MKMPKFYPLIFLLAFLSLIWPGPTFANQRAKKENPTKRVILLVAFGTTVTEAQKAFDKIESQTKEAFPGVEIRWAFTSKTVRSKLASQGKYLDSPETALAKLMDEGYTHVAVLSLHIIPGEEFHGLYKNVQLYAQMAGGFQRIMVARPLLSSPEDMQRVAKALLKHLPADRKEEDAVLFMGHGTKKHPSDALYPAMNFILQDLDRNTYIASVDGYPSLEDVLPKLLERQIRKVYLVPFMTVAGIHVRDDLVGDEPDSWKSVLAKKGITSEAFIAGIAEYPEVVEIWLDHLREVYAQL
jgi:sirohydrochlorin cobaltochelatase